jgi:hypothetical protein
VKPEAVACWHEEPGGFPGCYGCFGCYVNDW